MLLRTVDRVSQRENPFLVVVVPSKRTFLKKSGAATGIVDKRSNSINLEEQNSSSSSDDLKTMTEVRT